MEFGKFKNNEKKPKPRNQPNFEFFDLKINGIPVMINTQYFDILQTITNYLSVRLKMASWIFIVTQ